MRLYLIIKAKLKISLSIEVTETVLPSATVYRKTPVILQLPPGATSDK